MSGCRLESILSNTQTGLFPWPTTQKNEVTTSSEVVTSFCAVRGTAQCERYTNPGRAGEQAPKSRALIDEFPRFSAASAAPRVPDCHVPVASCPAPRKRRLHELSPVTGGSGTRSPPWEQAFEYSSRRFPTAWTRGWGDRHLPLASSRGCSQVRGGVRVGRRPRSRSS